MHYPLTRTGAVHKLAIVCAERRWYRWGVFETGDEATGTHCVYGRIEPGTEN